MVNSQETTEKTKRGHDEWHFEVSIARSAEKRLSHLVTVPLRRIQTDESGVPPRSDSSRPRSPCGSQLALCR